MRPDAVGPYKIERELGRGGMGEVYLALDTRLDRQVAIKSLPAHVATDPDRLARFQREAKVLASLNHPGIGAIYGIEESAGHQYLILELIEGETLADRMTRGAIPVEDALALASQIAGAMEAAHDRGVVHRDLKPGNVMVTPDGVVKVLDFGLARTSDTAPPSTLLPASGPDSPTVAMPGPVHSPTIPGVIMGSAGYMSPEQARGRPVDKRSDIFSFGCVLFEMLTGDLPFQGETVADTIGATLHKELDFGRLPPETPPTIRLLLARCLTKNRADRLHDIGDARLEIAQAIRDPKGTMLGLGGQTGPSRTSRGALPFVLAGAIAVVGGTFPLWSALVGLEGDATRAGAGRQVVRFTIEPPEGYTLPLYIGGGTGIAISPAGDRIAFIAEIDGKSHLCLRDVARAESRVLPNTERCGNPFFSPDGKWLGFISKDRLMKMPAEGGPALAICNVTNYSSFAWLDDGTIVWGGGISGIWRVRADGGTPEHLAEAGPESKAPEGAGPVLGFDVPVGVPGADYILSGSWDGPTTESFNVMAVSLKDGSVRTVVRTAAEPRLIAPDLLAFTRGTTVMTVGFDPVRGVIIGEPTVALEGVRTDQWQDSAYIAGSRSGAFAYVPGGRFGSGKRLVGVDQSGKATPLLDSTDNYNSAPAVSPDGRRIAITTLRTMVEVWVLDLERRSMSLVSSGGEHYGPTWSVDGASILALHVAPSGTSAIARWPASGSGEPLALPGTSNMSDFYLPLQELADGSGLLLQTMRTGVSDKPDIAIYNYAKASFTPVRNRPAEEVDACISPDGNMIAYGSDESGRLEVYVGPLNAPGPNIQVSTQGGAWPRFSSDGKRLFFVDPNEVMMAATIEARGAAPAVSLPTKLFDAKSLNVQSTTRSGFGVLPGDTFVMIEKAPWELQPPVIHVILNWAEELRTKSPASR